MSSIKDGGAAFPIQKSPYHNGADGMSLRDYFAAAALPYALTLNGSMLDRVPAATREAYRIADAMIAQSSVQS